MILIFLTTALEKVRENGIQSTKKKEKENHPCTLFMISIQS
jgi:hypothetical protein